MLRRTVLKGIAVTAAGGFIARPAIAADTVLKIGMSIPMTGAGFAAVGRQLKAAIGLYMQQHGDTVAGRKIELTLRDDGGVADTARRTIQEMMPEYNLPPDLIEDVVAALPSPPADTSAEWRYARLDRIVEEIASRVPMNAAPCPWAAACR